MKAIFLDHKLRQVHQMNVREQNDGQPPIVWKLAEVEAPQHPVFYHITTISVDAVPVAIYKLEGQFASLGLRFGGI